MNSPAGLGQHSAPGDAERHRPKVPPVEDDVLGRLRRGGTARRLKKEIGRFSVVGLVNAMLTFAIFTSLLRLFNVDYHVALLAAWLAGIIFSYGLNFVWVFTQADNLAFDSRFLKFMATGLLSITFNLTALHLLVDRSGGDPFWLQVVLMPLIVGFNFCAAKFWSLRQANG